MPERNGEELGQFELKLSKLLAGGVIFSMVLTIAGIAWFFVAHANVPPAALDLSLPHPDATPHTPRQVLDALKTGDPLSLMALGLFVLILTPILRVATSLWLFVREGDRIYTLISLFVLAMLLLGMRLGLAG